MVDLTPRERVKTNYAISIGELPEITNEMETCKCSPIFKKGTCKKVYKLNLGVETPGTVCVNCHHPISIDDVAVLNHYTKNGGYCIIDVIETTYLPVC